MNHLHPDHTCPRCRDEENRLRPDYIRPSRRPTNREIYDDRELWRVSR